MNLNKVLKEKKEFGLFKIIMIYDIKNSYDLNSWS